MQFQPNIEAGAKYNMLLLTGRNLIKTWGGGKRRFIEVICDCGKTFFAYSYPITSGKVKSCGCKKRAFLINRNTTYNISHHALYKVWQTINRRCYSSKSSASKNYYHRNIRVCEEWHNSAKCFYDWAIENGWHNGLSIDRINPDGDYEPSNCRLATPYMQSRNKRNNIYISAFGEIKCFRDWVLDIRCKVSHAGLFYRLHTIGMNPQDAISTPPFNTNIKNKRNASTCNK